MAKTSIIERNKKRKRVYKKFLEEKNLIKNELRKNYLINKVDFNLNAKLQKFPKNSSITRIVSRCRICGRGRSVYKKFELCRLCLRENVMLGLIPGLKKSSW